MIHKITSMSAEQSKYGGPDNNNDDESINFLEEFEMRYSNNEQIKEYIDFLKQLLEQSKETSNTITILPATLNSLLNRLYQDLLKPDVNKVIREITNLNEVPENLKTQIEIYRENNGENEIVFYNSWIQLLRALQENCNAFSEYLQKEIKELDIGFEQNDFKIFIDDTITLFEYIHDRSAQVENIEKVISNIKMLCAYFEDELNATLGDEGFYISRVESWENRVTKAKSKENEYQFETRIGLRHRKENQENL